MDQRAAVAACGQPERRLEPAGRVDWRRVRRQTGEIRGWHPNHDAGSAHRPLRGGTAQGSRKPAEICVPNQEVG